MVQSLKGDGKAIFVFFIGAIIAIVFLASIANSVFTQTTTATIINDTVTAPAAVNGTLSVSGRDLIAVTVISNGTEIGLQGRGLVLSDGILNGVKTVILTSNDTAGQVGNLLNGTSVNLTYTYNPQGYISIAGGRTIALLITIMSALAILIFAVVTFIKDGSLGSLINNNLMRRKE